MSDHANYHAAAFRTVTSIFLVLALGGLFIGLLQPTLAGVHNVFAVNFFGTVGDVVPAALNGSLFGYLWAFFATAFTAFDFSSLTSCLSYLRVFLLAGSVVAAIVCFVVSICSKAAARRCALASAVLVTMAYTWFYAAAMFYSVAVADLYAYDWLHLIFVAIMLITLFVTGICTRKGAGLMNALGLLLTLVFTVACVYPGSTVKTLLGGFLASPVRAYFQSIDFGAASPAFLQCMPVVLFVLLALNFVSSFIRMATKKGFAYDAVRYTLLFVGAVLFMVAVVANGVGFTEFFKNGESIALAPVLFIAVSGILCIAFLCAALVARGKSRREFVETLADTYDEDEEEDEDESHRLAPVYINNVNVPPATPGAPVMPVATPVAPMAPATPAPATPAPAYPQPQVYVQPQPVYQTPYVQPYVQPVYYPVASPASNNGTPANPNPVTPATPANVPEEPMSEFEQRMAALAKGETPVSDNGTPANPNVQPAPAPETYGTYVYDTFFTSLPTKEKNEFGDLFIGKKYGDFGLPTYNIGEDNSEFFQKFFIYLAKIRPHISSELLAKIYNYINRK